MSTNSLTGTLPPRSNTLLQTLARQFRMNLQTYALIGALILIWVYFYYNTDGLFLNARNFSNLFRQMTVTAFLSIGMVLVIVTGHIDLSVGKLAGFVSVVVAYFQANKLTEQFPENDMMVTLLSVLIGVGVGLIVGIIQGYVIAYLRVTAFIVTLGSMWLLNGAILLVTEGKTIPANVPMFSDIGQGYLPSDVGWMLAGIIVLFLFYAMIRNRQMKRRYNFKLSPLPMDILKTALISGIVVAFVYKVNQYKGVQNPVALLAFFAIAVAYLSNNTRFGRYAYAIGGNREASRLSGVNIRQNVFAIFVLMGFLCGVSGVTMASYVGYGTISAGQGYELDAIAACILGGTSTMGGEGTVWGALVGALIMVSLTNGLQMMNTEAAYQYILKGLVLVAAVYIDVRLRRSR